MTKKIASPVLSDMDYADLVERSGVIYFDRARLQVINVGRVYPERKFVMQGPSGVHSLLVDATDLARLNSHWVTFCADPRNRYGLDTRKSL
jgi:hypothetical protein